MPVGRCSTLLALESADRVAAQYEREVSIMIRVSVIYPNEPGKRFDWAYYLDKHQPSVGQRLFPLGLQRKEVDRGIGTAQPGAPPPFLVMSHMYFATSEDMQKCLACAGELMSDIPNFTDIKPQIQISEVL
jgi:uncharacterized protein (TIGR02118 family)